MTRRMSERAPTAQDKIKGRTHGMKEYITGEHDNIKHMTNRMVESIPNGQVKVKRRAHTKKNKSAMHMTI